MTNVNFSVNNARINALHAFHYMYVYNDTVNKQKLFLFIIYKDTCPCNFEK